MRTRYSLAALLLSIVLPALGERISDHVSAPKHSAKATNILWRDPGQIEALDFVNGVGGHANAPLPPFRFIEEEMTGSNPKIKVRDARGATWSVKWSDEAKPEVFANRLAWASG